MVDSVLVEQTTYLLRMIGGIELAISIIGYPPRMNFCPECGSSDVEADDNWNGSGKLACKQCGCSCYMVEADDSHKEDYVSSAKEAK